jgi:lipoxygenase homology domain-containing protein 1
VNDDRYYWCHQNNEISSQYKILFVSDLDDKGGANAMKFQVTVQTGKVGNAGTDAKVFITMNGEKNKIAKRQLQKPEGGKNAFEKGNKDVFKFDGVDIGKVCSIFRDTVRYSAIYL